MRNVRRALVAAAIAAASIGVGAPPASACTDDNEWCRTINFVCQTVAGSPCLR